MTSKFAHRYLITGAQGQLGHELTTLFGDSAMPKSREALDVTRLEHVREWIPTLRPDVVIHCAAYSPFGGDLERDEKARERCWLLNVIATDNLLKTCAAAGIPFVYISSNRVFGQDPLRNDLYTPEDPVGPVGFYAQSKVAAEHAILRLGQDVLGSHCKNKFRYWIVRSSCLFERPWRHYRNVAQEMLKAYESKSAVPVPANARMNFTYVPHLARSIRYLVEHRRDIVPGIYHVANGDPATPFEFAQTLGKVLHKPDIMQPAYGQSPLPRFTGLDTDLFSQSTGGPSLPCWQDAVQEYCYELAKAA